MDRLQEFFEFQADHHPDNIALICNDIALSYAQLEHRANQWAHLLKSQGTGPGCHPLRTLH
jgi:non-ribosomal peptide synthetase component F